jgi:hypothetical protein
MGENSVKTDSRNSDHYFGDRVVGLAQFSEFGNDLGTG